MNFYPLACSSLFLMCCGTWASETVPLGSLDLSHLRQGWGTPKVDRSVEGKLLTIGARTFAHGVGTHARSELWLDLGGKGERFQSVVGVDAETTGSVGSVVFKVIVDGRVAFDSGLMRPDTPARDVDVDLHGAKNLLLLVTSGGDSIDFDHADWAEARLVMSEGKPGTMPPPREEAVVLTPKPSPKPRINGTTAFGVRPGSPFLFTIPATGERPMRFSANGLPPGLTLDETTGRISGTLDKPGEHAVMLHATNRLGNADRRFRIVCGKTLALTPHMGWNSWYVWENHVTDRIMREAADAMVSSGLIDHGYMYVNIDDCWSIKPGANDPTLIGEARDARGRINSNGRFPDMKAMTDYIHSKGLKAGIYSSPGPLTCAGHVGCYQHEAEDAARFAEWGFDFLKYDWCSYGQIAKDQSVAELRKPYEQMSAHLERQPRDIVFNLCQYGMGNVWEWGKGVGGNSWRTAGDLGGSFEGIGDAMFRDGFGLDGKEKWGGPGGWNDPDYLLLGYISNWRGQTVPTPLTPNEQYTHVTLWSLLAAPLILSGDITRLDEFTLGLLTNDEVIEIDQDALGKPGRRVAEDRAQENEVWVRSMEDGTYAVGLFNRGEAASSVTARWADVGVSGRQVVRDAWRQADQGIFDDKYEAIVPRHGCVLIRLRPAK